MKLPVIFNGGSLVSSQPVGVQRNTVELLKELDKIINKNEVQLVIPTCIDDALVFENIEVVKIPVAKKLSGNAVAWDQWYFPRYLRSNHGLGVDLLRAMPIVGCDVVMIYDCILEKYPPKKTDIKANLKRWYYIFKTKMCIQKSKLILSDSKDAAAEIEAFYHLKPGCIHVVPCGWEHIKRINVDNKILSKLNIERKKYIFALGTNSPHKNLKWVNEAAKNNRDILFIISGVNTDLDNSKNDVSNVIYTGYLSDTEVKALMVNSYAFVQPTFCEGFGIPPLEALACGAKIIVSDIPVMHEIYGNSAYYLNPNDAKVDIHKLLSGTVHDSRAVLDKYTWKRSAYILAQVLGISISNEY